MNTPADIVKALEDAASILEDVVTGQGVLAVVPALDLVKQVLLALPPIDAADLDPVDRAAADKEAADLEAAKFGPAK